MRPHLLAGHHRRGPLVRGASCVCRWAGIVRSRGGPGLPSPDRSSRGTADLVAWLCARNGCAVLSDHSECCSAVVVLDDPHMVVPNVLAVGLILPSCPNHR